jgi:hypothetical protein
METSMNGHVLHAQLRGMQTGATSVASGSKSVPQNLGAVAPFLGDFRKNWTVGALPYKGSCR